MKCSQLLRLLKKHGWYVDRQGKGSHVIMRHSEKDFPLVVPDHGSKEMKKGTEKSILKQAGIRTG